MSFRRSVNTDRLAQSVEHETLDHKVVGSSPTLVDSILSFLVNVFMDRLGYLDKSNFTSMHPFSRRYGTADKVGISGDTGLGSTPRAYLK